MMIDAETDPPALPGNWQNDRSRRVSAPVDNITAVVVLLRLAVSCWADLLSRRQRGCILIDAVAARGLVGRRRHDNCDCDYLNQNYFDAAATAATTTTRLLVLCGRLDSNYIFPGRARDYDTTRLVVYITGLATMLLQRANKKGAPEASGSRK
jgi:hypothetical protein